MIVNVCPTAVSSAPPDRVWTVLTNFERFGDWNDATYVSADPPGPTKRGQVIHLTAPALGRKWPVTIDVGEFDPNKRWIDLLVHLPFGVDNQERVTLSETDAGGTLVRFN